MHFLYEPEIRRLHREEMMREAERARLARRLRAEKGSGGRRNPLERMFASLRAVAGGKARTGGCEG